METSIKNTFWPVLQPKERSPDLYMDLREVTYRKGLALGGGREGRGRIEGLKFRAKHLVNLSRHLSNIRAARHNKNPGPTAFDFYAISPTDHTC